MAIRDVMHLIACEYLILNNNLSQHTHTRITTLALVSALTAINSALCVVFTEPASTSANEMYDEQRFVELEND
jgi:hypothetical protein